MTTDGMLEVGKWEAWNHPESGQNETNILTNRM